MEEADNDTFVIKQGNRAKERGCIGCIGSCWGTALKETSRET